MSEATPPPREAPRKLPLLRILVGAFVLTWRNRLAVARVAGVPILFVVITQLAWHTAVLGDSETAKWMILGSSVCAFAWLAIATHRLVLNHGWAPHESFAEFSLRRFALYVGALLLAWIALQMIMIIMASVLANIVIGPRYVATGEVPPSDPPREYFDWIMRVADVISYVVVARFALLLPAVAVDRIPNPMEAWRLGRRNTLRLAVVVGVLPWTLDWLTFLLWRDDATIFEVACLAILIGVFAIVGFVALSLSYYELTHESAPPPTHPPG